MHMLVLADLQEQIEFLGEQRVVILQPETKERKRLDGRTAAHDHFRASSRQQIERCEALKYPYRVGGAQNRDSAGETDTVRSCRRCSENDRGSGIEELPTVMFPDAKAVQARLIGVYDLFDKLLQTVLRPYSKTRVIESGREAVNPYLHLSASCSRAYAWR
jgi:hypothetical protein